MNLKAQMKMISLGRWRILLSIVVAWSVLVGLAASTRAAERATAADPIVGEWTTEAKDSRVRIGVEGGRYVGRISWLKEPNGGDGKPARDEKNADPSLRSRALIGLPILWNLQHGEGKEYENGTVYDPSNGKSYSGTAKLESPRELKLRGYVGISLFGRTETWSRN